MSKKVLKTHYSAMEIAAFKLKTAPHAHKNVQERAKRENWIFRKREGRGGGLEYEFAALPKDIQAEILTLCQTQVVELPETTNTQQMMSAALWARYENACDKQKDEAKVRFKAVLVLSQLISNGTKWVVALEQAALQCDVPAGSLKNWYYKVKDFERDVWVPMLVTQAGKNKTPKFAEFDDDAWSFFCTDYLRQEKPDFMFCYRNLQYAAELNGWKIPSRETVKRKIARDIPPLVLRFFREGNYSVMMSLPPQRRTVAHLNALDIVNGDGYKHNVFVQWSDDPNAKPIRPVTWFWQDVRTRKILAWCTDDTENPDSIRIALMRLIRQYGIPHQLTLDNTTSASNRQMTGRSSTRKRYKVREDDPIGVFEMLGVDVVHTSIIEGHGHGQAKPIERTFGVGGLGVLIDKDQSIAGYHTGDSIDSQPEYYDHRKGVDKATFLSAVEQGVAKFNAQLGRDTELGNGVLSFDQIWERDYAKVTVRMPTEEQLRILMLLGESTKLDKKHGTFTLKSGGEKTAGYRNRYYAERLIGSPHDYVQVRFDPYNLFDDVYVYSMDGKFICSAVCVEDVAFDSMKAAMLQKRDRQALLRSVREQAKRIARMDEREMTAARAKFELPETQPGGIEPVNIAELLEAPKADWDLDENEEESQFLQAFQKVVNQR